MADYDQFVNCMKIQEQLDMEAFDVMFFHPMQDLYAWWTRQSAATQAYMSFLSGTTVTVVAYYVGKVAGIAAAEVAALFATFLIAIWGAVALGPFMASVGRCLGQQI